MATQEELHRELSEEYNKLEGLVNSTGWARLMEIADGQFKVRLPTVLGSLDNLLELGKQEFAKGEIAGIELFKVIPHKRLEDLKASIELIDKEIENATRSGKSDTDGNAGAPGLGAGPGDSAN